MNYLQNLDPAFDLFDSLALALFVVAWLGIGWLIEHPPQRRPSVCVLMQSYRREWMVQFITRQPRIFDATLIESLRQGTAFFASATMIAIGGGVALISNASTVVGLAEDLTIGVEAAEVQVKVVLVVALMGNALLKFVWSNRLFGYCAILMAAVPNEVDDPRTAPMARQAAEINITAARSFNRGLHSVYFALGALAWLIGPEALIAATLATAAVLIRREFASHSRAVMLEGLPPA
jgi:uncharacterized membrane protein